MPKPLRSIPSGFNFSSIRPPYDGRAGRVAYEYFKEVDDFRSFDPAATSFDIVNAWWLSEASALSYADPGFAIPRFAAAGLGAQFLSREGTECFLAEKSGIGIVAFRGTGIPGMDDTLPGLDLWNVLTDVETNLRTALRKWASQGDVHEGYRRAVEDLWPDLEPHLRRLRNDGKTIWMTGQSMGAALATVAAARFPDVAALYTFGSPRVGDAAFQEGYKVPTYRIFNNNDLVPSIVPPLPDYVHVGEVRYIDRRGQIHEGSNRAERTADQFLGLAEALVDGNTVPDPIVDHVPIIYAAHLWNNLPGVGGE